MTVADHTQEIVISESVISLGAGIQNLGADQEAKVGTQDENLGALSGHMKPELCWSRGSP